MDPVLRVAVHMEIILSSIPSEIDYGTLIVKLWRHDLLQESCCAVCGRNHEEQFVVVAVFLHHQFRGSLCLRCLSRSPGSTSEDAGSDDSRDPDDGDLKSALQSLTDWPVTLADLQSAETEAVLERFPLLRPDDVKRIVDDRFQLYRDRDP